MIALINANVDDVVDTQTAVRWLNAGQNQMAIEARANFSQLDASNSDDTFDFPEKYHETPVLYACAMYQGSESSLSEKTVFMQQFSEGLKSFIENYDIPMEFRDDSTIQQFIKTSTDNNQYFITKRGYSNKSNLKVYINGFQTSYFYLIQVNGKQGFELQNIVNVQEPQVNDKITATWEDIPEMIEPPYSWWKGWS